ncbi:hypothetical protein Naga_100945g1 [Nannochloropsis gaditana]|uniref:Uncharacterized protein n=1 Tax=Nannochloropsis gaditana TaxID=72520 RepID=W7T8V7_9STRA|nr:hypothetical protein Naga_100945g1 [Nannochloropsis gaditana]
MRRLSFSSTGRITLLPSFYVAALLLNVLMLTIEGWHVPTVRSSSLLTNKIRSHGSIFPFCSTSSTSPVCCRPPRPTLTRLHANFPEDEQEEEEWPGSLRRSGQEGGNGGGGGEGPNGPRGQDVQPDVVMVDMTEDGEPPRVTVKASYNVNDDLGPVISTLWRGIVLLDREGTSRRSAQMTILSVGCVGEERPGRERGREGGREGRQ